jgi:hypothetical protein
LYDKDRVPLGHGSIPRYYYAFHAKAVVGNFDLSVLFQGIGDYYAAGEKITYPALSTQVNSNHQASSFFLENKSYLRLKNAEIGYAFPARIAKLIGAERIRLTASGQNLLTWHKLTGNEYGPEGDYLSIPVYRLYNIGLSVQF